MKALLKIELERAFKNKWFYITLLIGMIFVLIDVKTVAYDQVGKNYETYLDISVYQMPGAYYAWMVTHSGQIYKLLHLIYPLLISLPYSYSIYSDIKNKYICNIVIRTDRKKYYASKLITQFIVGFAVVAIILFNSFLLTAAVLPLEKPTRAARIYKCFGGMFLDNLFYKKPLLACMIFIILESLIFAIIGCISFIFAYILNNGIMVMMSSFIIYYMEYIISSLEGKSQVLNSSMVALVSYEHAKRLIVELVILIIIIIISYIIRVKNKDVV